MLAELFACEPRQCDACQPRKAQMSEDRATTQTRMTDRHRALREAQTAQRLVMAKKQDPDGVRSMSSVESPLTPMSLSHRSMLLRVAPSVTESRVGPNGEAPTSLFQDFERRVERVGASGHQLCVEARARAGRVLFTISTRPSSVLTCNSLAVGKWRPALWHAHREHLRLRATSSLLRSFAPATSEKGEKMAVL